MFRGAVLQKYGSVFLPLSIDSPSNVQTSLKLNIRVLQATRPNIFLNGRYRAY